LKRSSYEQSQLLDHADEDSNGHINLKLLHYQPIIMKSLTASIILGLSLGVAAKDVKEDNKLSTTPAKRATKWWMPRHKQKLEEKKKLGDVQLVFLGDSITHAWESKGKKIWNERYAKFNALNLGFSGDRTEHVLWRLQNGAIDGISPKVVVMMIGTNNVGQRNEESTKTAAGIKAILELIKEKQPKTKILMLGIFPRGAKTDNPKRKLNDGTNEIIEKFADGERVHYLNINKKFLEADGTLSKKVMPDLLHPSAPQYKVWADAIDPTLNKLLAAEKK